MIKARYTNSKTAKTIIVLGLDAENMRRLMNNQPIKFDGRDIGIKNTVFFIFGGQTLDDIKEDLRSIGLEISSNVEQNLSKH